MRTLALIFSLALLLLYPNLCLSLEEPSSKDVPARKLLSLMVGEGRALLETDGKIEGFRYFELTGPARLVLDIQKVVPELEKASYPATDGFKILRVGHDHGTTRVVLEAEHSNLPSYSIKQRDRTIEVTWQKQLPAPISEKTSSTISGRGPGESELSGQTPTPEEMTRMRQFLEAEREQLARLQQQFAEEQSRYMAYRDKLEKTMNEQQQRIEAMQVKLGMAKPSTQPAQPVTPATTTRVASTAGPATPAQPVGRPPEKQPEEEKYQEIEAIFERQGVLTPKGKWVLEPSLQYSYSSSTRVALLGYTIIPAITIGLIDVRSVNRNAFVGALTTRYGLTNRMELELKIPYVYRDESSSRDSQNTDDTPESFDSDGNDLGDIEFGLRYQFNMPQGNGPIFIGGIRVKSDSGTDPFEVDIDPDSNLPSELPTGSGFWGIQPSLTAIFPSDPAVFFGSVSYMYYFDRNDIDSDKWGFSDVEPGDTIGFNFGVGYGINEKASFSLGYEHNIILKSKFDDDEPPGAITTHVGSLLLGGSYRLSNNSNLNLSLSGGLTEEAPDVQLTLRVPMTF
ncbi:MAG: transporter [Syntrophotaleaceae bacterium]